LGREQAARRGWILELDEVRLVLDDERGAEPAGERRVAGLDVDADLADRRMRQEVAAEERVGLGLHRAALPPPPAPRGAPPPGAGQAEPAAARLQPALDGAALCGVGVRPGHVRDEE